MIPRVPQVGLVLLAFEAQLAVNARKRATRTSAVLAAGMGVGSVWFMGGSVAGFRRRSTTVNPISPGATALVTSGPNRVTRNPMYVGMAGILAAYAIMHRAPRPRSGGAVRRRDRSLAGPRGARHLGHAGAAAAGAGSASTLA